MIGQIFMVTLICFLLFGILIIGSKGCNVGGAEDIDYWASGIICFILWIPMLCALIADHREEKCKERLELGLPEDTIG